jgi:hypothetical protein
MSDRSLEATCGLYCGACPLLLQRKDDWIYRAVRARFAEKDEDLLCHGCRTDVLSISCRDCPKRACAKGRGLDSCAACPEMPCKWYAAFRLPHGAEIVPNLEALRDRGSDVWLREQAGRWRCATCGRAGSWYERVCPDCGAALPAGHEPLGEDPF